MTIFRTLSESSLKQGGDLTDHDDSKSIVSGEIPKSQAGTVNSGVGSVEELEKLLGAYFVQIGSTLNKLSMLNEYVEDTEDYINITLDDKQNRILQTGVHIGTISVIVNSFIVVTGSLQDVERDTQYHEQVLVAWFRRQESYTLGNTHCRVKDDKNAAFWYSKWICNQSLKDVFPELFASAVDPFCSVADAGQWELGDFLAEFKTVLDADDDFVWIPEKEKFSVKSAYVDFLSRLPTRDQIVKRRILCDDKDIVVCFALRLMNRNNMFLAIVISTEEFGQQSLRG
ncbi:hypothetical protein KIW84_065768 [Lathyrus oleraceus]|uniref:Uncharacterized protein n=1 Tax=Pisum sativum TaxID=3888 RepID=A0A9D4WDX7_PEA|nr:hypothetical protein KIW84_065768 [Pisum sativum]